MKADFSLSVVLPAYNESENIEKTVTEVVSYVKKTFGNYEVIVVNDGSIDRTPEIVEELSLSNPKIILVNHPKNLGYGSALRSGFERASLDYIFLIDSDGQFDISDIDRLLPYLVSYDVIIGYREKRADPFIRSLNTWLYHLFIRSLFGLKVKDIDCAFKIFPRSAYNSVKPVKSGGALFSAEFLIKLERKGFTIKEVPVRHFPRRFGSPTGANPSVILRMFKECRRLRNELRDNVEKNQVYAFFPIFVLLGLILRIFLSLYWIYEGDFNTWKGWAYGISKVGFSNFYDKYWCDYMPGYLYILWLLDHIHRAFPRLPDEILFKLPANLSDFGISILIFYILKNITDIKNARLASIVYFFNPASLSNSTFWGQVDSVHAFPILISVALGLRGNLVASSIFASLAFMIKPQSVVVFPFIGFFAIKILSQKEDRVGLKVIISGVKILAALTFTSFIVALPFIWSEIANVGGIFKEPIYFIRERFDAAYTQYKYASLNAFNFWGMVAMWQSDQTVFLNITYQKWGITIFGVFYALVLMLLFRPEITRQKNIETQNFASLYSLQRQSTFRAIYAVTLTFFALFLFVTRVHERHFLPTIVFFTLIAFRSSIYWLFYALISVVYVFNMFYSYIELAPRISESAKPYLILPASSLKPFIPVAVILLLIVFLIVLIDFIRNSVGLYRETNS